LTYGFKNLNGDIGSGIDFNGNWTFFAVVKLLKLNPRSIVGDFHVTFGVHPTSHQENDKFITSSLHERNGSVYVNATYGKGPLTSSSPDSFQLQTVSYSDLNLKQTMI